MKTGTAECYTVFVRNWWRWEQAPYPDALNKGRQRVPDPSARKTTIARHCTREEAIAICEQYQATHKPGPLSRKAEFTSE